jgi:parvulin-like peptidyl-prolyl isomerase
MRHGRQRAFRLLLVLLPVLAACTVPAPGSGPVVGEPTSVPVSTVDPADEPSGTAGTATPPPAPTATSEPLAALVNGHAITLAEYELQVARYEASMVAAGEDPDTPEGKEALAQGRRWVLDLMLEQILIEQQAALEGLIVTDGEVDAAVDALRADIGDEGFNAWLEQEGMDLDEMRERLRGDMIATQLANRIAARVPAQAEHVHARHIVVATEEEARRLLGQLQAGGDFASLARMASQDVSTRDLGGDLGFFPKGVLTSPDVEAAAFALQPGQLSDVIHSDLGYHIVQVVERMPDREVEPESLRLLRDQAVGEWLDQLRATADIQIFVTP